MEKYDWEEEKDGSTSSDEPDSSDDKVVMSQEQYKNSI